MTTSAPPFVSSSSVKSRPIAGRTPSTRKNDGDTCAAVIRSAGEPAIVAGSGTIAAMSANDVARARHASNARDRHDVVIGPARRVSLPQRHQLRRARAYGNGRSRIPWTTLKIAHVQPMPSANVSDDRRR